MKKNFLSIICGMVLVIIGLCGCSNDGADDTQLQVRNVASTGCKSSSVYAEVVIRGENPYKEYLEYKAVGNGFLFLKHVNALFNCAPGELNMQATISGNVIKILETEQQSLANCICPYDLSCEVGPLTNGDYVVIMCRGSYDYEQARFIIAYSAGLDGRIDFTSFGT